jgi:spermidine/putrescine transport system substrate-binding protein
MMNNPRRCLARLSLAMVFSAPLAQAEELLVSTWDGYLAPETADNFEKLGGTRVVTDIHATNEEIMAKVLAGNGAGYDVLFVSSPAAEILHGKGLLAEIDPAQVPNLKNLYPEASQLQYDPGNHFSVPYAWGTTGICYRADKVSPAPSSWHQLLQPSAAMEGKVTLLGTDRWLMAAGFLANGWNVNDQDPAHINTVREQMLKTRPHLLGFDDTTFHAKLVSGEAYMAQAWDGWCNYGTAENPQVKFVVPKEGSDLWVDTMVILKSSQHPAQAQAFINFILAPQNHLWVVENVNYKVPNKAAMDSVEPALLARFPNLTTTPTALLEMQQLRDVGDTTRAAYAKVVREVLDAR